MYLLKLPFSERDITVLSYYYLRKVSIVERNRRKCNSRQFQIFFLFFLRASSLPWTRATEKQRRFNNLFALFCWIILWLFGLNFFRPFCFVFLSLPLSFLSFLMRFALAGKATSYTRSNQPLLTYKNVIKGMSECCSKNFSPNNFFMTGWVVSPFREMEPSGKKDNVTFKREKWSAIWLSRRDDLLQHN